MTEARRNELTKKLQMSERDLNLATLWFAMVKKCDHSTPDVATVEFLKKISTELSNIASEIVLESDEYSD
jgi:hypothetical protein